MKKYFELTETAYLKLQRQCYSWKQKYIKADKLNMFRGQCMEDFNRAMQFVQADKVLTKDRYDILMAIIDKYIKDAEQPSSYTYKNRMKKGKNNES